MSPYPTVVMVTTAHQNASGIDLKNDWSEPASAKYTVLENSTTPGKQHAQRQCRCPLKRYHTYTRQGSNMKKQTVPKENEIAISVRAKKKKIRVRFRDGTHVHTAIRTHCTTEQTTRKPWRGVRKEPPSRKCRVRTSIVSRRSIVLCDTRTIIKIDAMSGARLSVRVKREKNTVFFCGFSSGGLGFHFFSQFLNYR